MAEPEKIRVAVVGLGIGLAHVVAFKEVRDRFRIVSVCDQNEDLARQTAEGLREVEVDALTLEHQSGALSTVSATLGSTPEVSRLRYSFAHLTAESNHEPYEFPRDPWTYTGDTPDDEAAMAAALESFAPGREGWAGQFDRFADALAGDGPLPVTLDDARHGLEVVTAAYRSARTGTDVELPIGSDDADYTGWSPP